MAVLFDLARETRRVLSQSSHMTAGAKSLIGEAASKLHEWGGLLGIVSSEKSEIPSEVEELARLRARMKTEKKYKEADEIRNRVLQMGFLIEDVQGGKFRILPKK
jgi:cysteinyl-tRNA synthetase